jgi:hypothetical protein
MLNSIGDVRGAPNFGVALAVRTSGVEVVAQV